MPASQRNEITLLTVLFLALCCSLVWIRTKTVEGTYQYVRLEKEFVRLQQEVQQGRVEWLRLTSPKRLDKLAASLNLRPPLLDQVVRYDRDKAPPSRTTR